MRSTLIRFAALVAVLASASFTATPQPAVAESPVAAASKAPADPSSCLWFGPTFTADDTELNYAFPDSGAGYWAAHISIPDGATLELKGEFARARYQSLNAYNTTTKGPVDALNDVSTIPDKGSVNPYLPHAKRNSKYPRSYSVEVSSQTPPTGEGAPNTLYAGVAGQANQLVLFRLYLPDNGTSPTGGVALPRPVVTLADGTELTGQEACAAISSDVKAPALDLMDPAAYGALRDQAGKPPTFPSQNPPLWRRFYNQQFTMLCAYKDLCSGTPARTGGQYSNIDNNYVYSYINRGFGEVLTLRGRLPRTPDTQDGAHRMDRKIDLRYWSLCSNESSLTTRVEGCVFDEHVVTDKNGWYTIVVSRPADRPKNATEACGVNWVEWPARGDGAGHLNDGFLILRNMLPSATFTQAVQDTAVPGDEKQVMGDYLPDGTYGDREGFEANGCKR